MENKYLRVENVSKIYHSKTRGSSLKSNKLSI